MTDPLPNDSITLDAELGLATADAFVAELGKRRGSDLVLDASNVDYVCAPFVQVLLSARIAWAKDERALTVANPSETFRKCIELLGAGDQILRESHHEH